MKLALALLALSTAAYASVAPLPEAPRPQPKHDYMGWSLLAGATTLRMLDAYSTERAHRCTCNEEVSLPKVIAYNPALMYSYSGAVVGMDWFIARELKRHGHTRLARIPYHVDMSIEVPNLKNFALPTQPHISTARRLQ